MLCRENASVSIFELSRTYSDVRKKYTYRIPNEYGSFFELTLLLILIRLHINFEVHNLFQRSYPAQCQKIFYIFDDPYTTLIHHFSSTAFATRGRTITTKDRSKQSIIDTYNRISGFSATDIKQLNLMYKGICTGKYQSKNTVLFCTR